MTGKRAFQCGLFLVLVPAFAALLGMAVVTASATATSRDRHLRLVNEGDPGPLYECDLASCEPAQTDDPSRKNRSRMGFYVLPDGCVELRSAWLRPDGPGVDVRCGPEGEGTSARYRCDAGACHPIDLPSAHDGAITRPIPLPADCRGRIHELIVLDATRHRPKIFIECDASSGPAGER